MHSCEKVIQSIWEFLDCEISSENMAELKKHLDLCRSCYTRVEFEKALREGMRQKTDHCCPEKLKEQIKKIIELY